MMHLRRVLQNTICVDLLKSKRFYSYLYVTGDRAREIYSSVQPHIDFDKRISNVSQLNDDLKKRKLSVDVGELQQLWQFYKTRLEHKQRLELNRKEIKFSLEKLIADNVNGSNDNEIDSLKLKFRLVRDDLKNITKTIWDIENNVVLKVLQIPNELHPSAPINEQVVAVHGDKFQGGHDHLEIGKHLDCLDYKDRSSYFLKKDVALFEFVASEYFVNVFRDCGFIPTKNADFGRSVLIEGCTLKSFAPDVAFVLADKDKKDHLYLSGGASLLPFFGLHTKHVLDGGKQPVRFVTSATQYNPSPISNLNGLYSVWQSPAIQIFISAIEKEELTLVYDDTIQNVIDLYKSLDVHFRVVSAPAHQLQPWESLRTSFQLYSSANNTYVEVGHVSLIGDFISKRLQAHKTKDKQLQFLNVISGTVVRLPVLIAVLLETSTKSQLHLPKAIKELMSF